MSPSVSKAYQERGVTKSGIVSYESAMAALKTAVLYYAAKNASINSLWLPEMVDRRPAALLSLAQWHEYFKKSLWVRSFAMPYHKALYKALSQLPYTVCQQNRYFVKNMLL